jgi:3-deoxy-D-manno-octulosonic-acid transferase
MLLVLKKMEIPVLMFSAIFRKDHRFFSGILKRYWSDVLCRIDYFHVQDEASFALLRGLGIQNIIVSGDTRYDRVGEMALQAQLSDRYIQWKGDSIVVVLGSSYAFEEEAVVKLVARYPNVKWVIAPHHIDEENVQRIERLFEGKTQRVTVDGPLSAKPILLLNTMGELGAMYKLGEVAIVGGGWGKGIHNVLEPAAHGCAVIWGPRAEKFLEARLMIKAEGGFQVKSQDELVAQLQNWLDSAEKRKKVGNAAKEMVIRQMGARDKVLKTIGEFWESEKR